MTKLTGAKGLIAELKKYARANENNKSTYETREMGEVTINAVSIEWDITDTKPYTCEVFMTPSAGVFRGRQYVVEIKLSEELLKESKSISIGAKVLLNEMKRQHQRACHLREKAGSLLDFMDSFSKTFVTDFSLILRDWFYKHNADVLDMEAMIVALKKPCKYDYDGLTFSRDGETGVILWKSTE